MSFQANAFQDTAFKLNGSLNSVNIRPVIGSTATLAESTTSTSHDYTLPSGRVNGDLLLLFVSLTAIGGVTTTPSGWTKVAEGSNGSTGACFYRIVDGTEVSPVNFTTTSAVAASGVCYRIRSGTFNPASAPVGTASSYSAISTPNSPALGVAWDEVSLWFSVATGGKAPPVNSVTTYPANYTYSTNFVTGTSGGSNFSTAIGQRMLIARFDDPPAFQMGIVDSGAVLTVAVRGVLDVPILGHNGDGLDHQDFTDLTDYGTQTDPLSDTLPEDFALGVDGYFGEDFTDFTDFTDYGSFTPTPDATLFEDFLLGDGSGLDFQDFTDTADYSFVAPALNYSDNVLNVPILGLVINFTIGCFHTRAWDDIADVPKTWTPVADVPATWSVIADVPKTWTNTPPASSSWTVIPDVPKTWTKDC